MLKHFYIVLHIVMVLNVFILLHIFVLLHIYFFPLQQTWSPLIAVYQLPEREWPALLEILGGGVTIQKVVLYHIFFDMA